MKVKEERKSKTGKTRKRKNLRYNGDASMKDVGLWSANCMYYTVYTEDIKHWGLCPVKMMSYADRFFFFFFKCFCLL